MLAWLGTFSQIIGAYVVAIGMPFAGYCFFGIGSGAWLFVAMTRKDRALLVLNVAFFIANVIGFINYGSFLK